MAIINNYYNTWAGVVSTKMESDEERSDLEESEMEEESEEDDEVRG